LSHHVLLQIQTNFSDAHYAERRNWCRWTWLQDAPFISGLKWHFYGGGRAAFEAPDDANNTLRVPAPDGKNTCSNRHRWMCRAAIGEPLWTRLVKADDDSYVSLPRLMAHPMPGDFGGMVIPSDGVRGGYPSGALVWYSRKAANIIANELPGGHYADDQEIGKLLKAHGIEPVHEPLIHSWLSWELNTPIPEPHNDILATHAVRTWDDFRKVHQRRLGVA
jgi:hypothetical protein